MRSSTSHIFWESMGVLLGIYLIVLGLIILLENFKIITVNLPKILLYSSILNIIFGIIGIVIDGFYFIPSFL